MNFEYNPGDQVRITWGACAGQVVTVLSVSDNPISLIQVDGLKWPGNPDLPSANYYLPTEVEPITS